MIIGVPKEIKNNENRVAITPAIVQSLIAAGHTVYVEQGAGLGSEIHDAEYEKVGAKICDAKTAWAAAMVIKVKEPQPSEYQYFYEGQILFTYFHLAPVPDLTAELLKAGVTAIAYETVQLDNGLLPLLQPMSEVAGRMAIQIGSHFLEKPNHGRGILLGGVPGVPGAHVVIIGGGIVGINAAKMAVATGATVTLLDTNIERLRYLDDIFAGRVNTVVSSAFTIAEHVKDADLLVGGVLIPGAAAPKLVTEAMVATMKPGSVIVDVAIDQGGSIETIDHSTTHDNPVYIKHDVIHYAVANMPGAVARTSTFALTNATHPYILQLANEGIDAVRNSNPLALGVNTYKGKLTSKPVAESQNYEYTSLDELL